MNRKAQDIKRYIIVIAILIAIVAVSRQYIVRLDMTEDQRYSISEPTQNMLRRLNQPLVVQVFLHGDLPSEYKHLSRNIRETLNEFKVYAGKNIIIEYKDPTATKPDSVRQQLYNNLQQAGITPRTVKQQDGNKIVFPGAMLKYGDKRLGVNFLKDGVNGIEENFDQSIAELEYELASTIKVLQQERKNRVAFVRGHGEAKTKNLQGAMKQLSRLYDVGFYDLSSVPEINDVEVLVIAQPTKAFSLEDKYKLDQFVLNGGNLLCFIDAMEVRRDTGGVQALPYDLEISDLLRQFGVRINENMVQDLNAAVIPVRAENNQIQLKPWSFHPLLNTFSDHIITKNLGPLLSKNIGTVDSVKADGVTKTPLVFTSKYTRVKGTPVVYSVEELRINTDENYYPQSNLPIAYLLEGTFTSMFKHRPKPDNVNTDNFNESGDQGKVMVCSDGEIILNEVDQKAGRPYPLGLNRFSRKQYDNKKFLENTVNYMVDESGVTQLRAKEFNLRPLDEFRIDDASEKLRWQLINMAGPLVVLLLFGIVRYYLRKMKYTKFK